MKKIWKYGAAVIVLLGFFGVFGFSFWMQTKTTKAQSTVVPQFGLNIGDYGRGHDSPQCGHNYIPSDVNNNLAVTDFWTPPTGGDSWYIGVAYHPHNGSQNNDNGYAQGDCVQFGIQQQNGGVYTTDFRVGIRVGQSDNNSPTFENGQNKASPHCDLSGNAMSAWTFTPWASQGGGSSAQASINNNHSLVCFQLEVQTQPLPPGITQISGVSFGGATGDPNNPITVTNQSSSCVLAFPNPYDLYENYGFYTGNYSNPTRFGSAGPTCPMSDSDGINWVSISMTTNALGAQHVSDNIPTSTSSGATMTVGNDGQPLTFAVKNTGSVPWTSDQSTLVPGSQTGTCPTGDDGSGSCTATYIYSSSKVMLKHISGSFTPSPDPAPYKETVKVTKNAVAVDNGCPGAFDDHANKVVAFLRKIVSLLAFRASAMNICNGEGSVTYRISTTYSVNGVTVPSPDIQPGQTVNFYLNGLTAPNGSGSYTEVWQTYDTSSNSTFGSPMPITIKMGNSVTVSSINSVTGEPVTGQWQFPVNSTPGTNPCGTDGTCPAGTAGTYTDQPTGSYTLAGVASTAGPKFALGAVRAIAQTSAKNTLSFADLVKQVFAPEALADSVCDEDAIAGKYPVDRSLCPADQTVFSQSLTDETSTINFAVTWDPLPAMQVSPSSFSFTATEGTNPASQPLTIANVGGNGSLLQWTATADAAWLSLSPSADNTGVSVPTPETPAVTINSSALSPGTYTGHIIVTAVVPKPGNPSPVSIPVTLTISTNGTGSGGTHAACVGGACAIVAGGGANQNGCSTVGASCTGGSYHLACVSNACAIVAGGGNNLDGCGTANASCSGGSGSNPPSPSCSFFTVDKSQIVPPQTATLSWNCAGLGSCSIDQNIGGVMSVGSDVVAPTSTTLYTLTCSGSSYPEDVNVTVNNPGIIEINP